MPLLTTSAIGARMVKVPEMAASGVAAVTTKVADESFNHAFDRSFRRMYEKLLPDTETAASAAMADEGLMGMAASSVSRRPDGGLVGACSIVVAPVFIVSGNGADPVASAAAAALPMLSRRAVGVSPPAVEGGSRMDAMAAVGAGSLSSVPVFGSSAIIAGRKATAVVSIASGSGISLRGVGPEYRL